MSEQKEKKMTMDTEKPLLEIEMPKLPPELLEPYDCLDALADVFVEEGVEYFWNLDGSGCFRMDNPVMQRGIKRIHVTHEAEAGFAAEAYGRVSRRPGVVMIGPGTGITNITSPLVQARCAQAPVVVVIAGSGEKYDGRWTQQGGVIASEVLSPLTKRPVRRLSHPDTVAYNTKLAFRDACIPPSGPIAVELTEEITLYYTRGKRPKWTLYEGYTPGALRPASLDMWQQQADPKLVEEAMKWLLDAEQPAIVAGEGVWFNDAQEELRELVHLTGIPCHARRAGRGAISEYDPLNCSGRARGRVMRATDRVLVLGLRVSYLENQGYPPFWGPATRYIQAQVTGEHINLVMATDFELIGNIKLMLRQMIDCVKSMGIKGPPEKWNKWREAVIQEKEKSDKRTMERSDKQKGVTPFHPDLCGRMTWEWLRDTIQDDYISMLGGWTATSFYSDWIRLREAGRILDATDAIGLGHPLSMAIGAALADKRRRPIIALMGDGDFYGGSGMAYQTAVKWEIPVIGIHMNNNSYCTNCDEVFHKTVGPTGDFYKDFMQVYPAKIRADEMVRQFGVHTEYVERDSEYPAALDRCLAAVREGQPAYINVITDPIVNNEIMGLFTSWLYGNIEYNDLTADAKYYVTEGGYFRPLVFGQAVPSWKKAYEVYKETGKIPEKV